MSSLIFSNWSYAFEARHEKQSSWFLNTCNMRSRSRAHTSSKYQNVLLLDTKNHIEIIKNIFSIIKDVLFTGKKYIFIVLLIWIKILSTLLYLILIGWLTRKIETSLFIIRNIYLISKIFSNFFIFLKLPTKLKYLCILLANMTSFLRLLTSSTHATESCFIILKFRGRIWVPNLMIFGIQSISRILNCQDINFKQYS